MDLRHIEAFIAVAEELHFGRAAERLHTTQPPLSRQIRQLERSLGASLLSRTTRRVTLTPVGEAFLPAAHKVMKSVEEAAAVAASAAHGEIGTVRIGVGGVGPLACLPGLVKRLNAEKPGIELVVVGQVYSQAGFDMVVDGSLDLAFVRLPAVREGVSTRVVFDERLILAVAPDHPLAGAESVELAELAEERFIAYPPGGVSSLRDLMVHACVDAGFTPRIVQYGPETSTIMAMVAAGLGVTLTVTSVLDVISNVVFVPLAGRPYQTQEAIAWSQEHLSPAAAAVLRIAEEVLPTP
ncbi:LysR family transcriptional regulator [Saccharopolyspora shandongensis]|uniref:DNA-binding transcriptional regulator, LysR family n=1 Tax=Saccharopolyspora shandongensis TaxID=418495 RepID=A0A1H2UNR0_9PSEU|nr:LysR family transcriptional regulator [Saccharopolyspora shandongensis]SDW57705.1 DNA-binding transcriptional regulator, LysR family [Saccharopolyspora shandongensis]